MKKKPSSDLVCSFCHKPEGSVRKLISAPSDYARAYICDECIAVCHTIIEDERGVLPENDEPVRERAFQEHYLIPELLIAVEAWARCPSESQEAAEKLGQMRTMAARIVEETDGQTHRERHSDSLNLGQDEEDPTEF